MTPGPSLQPPNPMPDQKGMRVAGESTVLTTRRIVSPTTGRRPFPMARLLLSFAAALCFAGCGSNDDAPAYRSATQAAPAVAVAADTVTAPASALDSAVADFAAGSGAGLGDQYDTARLDLNGDGREDGLVLLTGSDWCGSGGCTLLIFEGTEAGGFRLVSETSLVNGPVIVGRTESNGWRDILIPDPTEDRTVALEFNGAAYPSEPAGPAARSTAGDTVFEGEIGLF